MRPYYDLWGIQYSAKASGQIAAYGHAPVPKVFWYKPVDATGRYWWPTPAIGYVPFDARTSLPQVPYV